MTEVCRGEKRKGIGERGERREERGEREEIRDKREERIQESVPTVQLGNSRIRSPVSVSHTTRYVERFLEGEMREGGEGFLSFSPLSPFPYKIVASSLPSPPPGNEGGGGEKEKVSRNNEAQMTPPLKRGESD